jgi:hypothetical protein
MESAFLLCNGIPNGVWPKSPELFSWLGAVIRGAAFDEATNHVAR